jgi:hypothetical protein
MFKYLSLPCGQPDIDHEAWVPSKCEEDLAPACQPEGAGRRRTFKPRKLAKVAEHELLNSIFVKPWLRFTQTQP